MSMEGDAEACVFSSNTCKHKAEEKLSLYWERRPLVCKAFYFIFFPPFLKKEKALGRLSHVPERKTAKHVRFGASKRFKGII